MKPATEGLYDGYYKYDRTVAETYEETRIVERHWHREDAFVRRYLASHRIVSLLDLPVGTGRFLEHYTGIGRVTGVDISDEMLKEAHTKCYLLPNKAAIHLEQGDVLNLSYKNQEFDVAIVFRLFHLMPADLLPLAIQELCRVVRKDIVIQSYAPIVGSRQWSSRLKRRLQGVISSWFWKPQRHLPETSEQQPWLHIQAFYHPVSLLLSCFQEQGFVVSKQEVLDIYGNTEVRATVYSRQD